MCLDVYKSDCYRAALRLSAACHQTSSLSGRANPWSRGRLGSNPLSIWRLPIVSLYIARVLLQHPPWSAAESIGQSGPIPRPPYLYLNVPLQCCAKPCDTASSFFASRSLLIHTKNHLVILTRK